MRIKDYERLLINGFHGFRFSLFFCCLLELKDK